MKNIKILDTTFDTITLYKRANTQAQRALAGYIIKSGNVHDPIFGGAFALLCAVERCTTEVEIYKLIPMCDQVTEKKIEHVAQIALDGKLDKFAFGERERNDTIKYLSEPM